MEFKARLVVPDKTNKYYLHYSKGGYNTCIVMDNSGNVLPNCVGYAHGRFLECQDAKKVDWTIPNCNAEDFIETAIKNGYKVGNEPKLGAIIVWSVGALHNGADGAGHVAIVEQVNADGSIVTSESGYKSKAYFWTTKRTNANGNWGANAPYKFLGFVYQKVEYTDAKPESKALYKVQVGAYTIKSNADAMLKNLKSKGFDGIIKESKDIMRVQVGAYSQKSNAEDMVKKLKAKGFNAIIKIEE